VRLARGRPALWLLFTLALTGCGPRERAEPAEIASNQQLETGNARFMARDPHGAREAYRAALAADSLNAAAWYGVYMSSMALRDSAAAAEALQQVERLAPEADLSGHPHDPAPPGSPRAHP
jgi:Tfp pilus assembly protein PilF